MEDCTLRKLSQFKPTVVVGLVVNITAVSLFLYIYIFLFGGTLSLMLSCVDLRYVGKCRTSPQYTNNVPIIRYMVMRLACEELVKGQSGHTSTITAFLSVLFQICLPCLVLSRRQWNKGGWRQRWPSRRGRRRGEVRIRHRRSKGFQPGVYTFWSPVQV